MKKLSILSAFFAGIIVTCVVSWKSNETVPKTDNPPVLAVRKVKLKNGVSAEAFEKFAARAAHDEFGKLPGVRIYFGKGERGDEPNTYALFFEFDSKSTRGFYAPSEDDNAGRSAEASKLLDAFFASYDPEFDKLAEVITPAGKKGYVDYLIIQ